jgi:probable addiction module antidote protein
MNKRLKDYQEQLICDLKDSKEAMAYINAALLDEDPKVFLLALRNVIEAQNRNVTEIAKKSKLNRENLYRMLSLKGNPKISSLIPVLHALGLQLVVQESKV